MFVNSPDSPEEAVSNGLRHYCSKHFMTADMKAIGLWSLRLSIPGFLELGVTVEA